ncbi:hypothetical protein SAMN06295933_0278 [Desulfovibrio gilichinskyi]|uniref:Mor transcription activator family protein n=1 Tax=Desulfovibrio gilichinskyi TaxID=1519643 RepID=A0A1X7C3R7_9BACT|nr:hypothetical protein SAMN06295933_0278 [Desulfovibrio gilichinskyi]
MVGQGSDSDKIGVEFIDLALLIGEPKARELCEEYKGQILPEPPPKPRQVRNKTIRDLYFKDGLTQTVISKRYGLTRRWINYIISSSD